MRKTSTKPSYFRQPKLQGLAEKILSTRCSMTDAQGDPLETTGEIFYRVASHMAKAEVNWGGDKAVETVTRAFFESMTKLKLICTRSALFEAGNPSTSNQLSPCFVIPIEDSITSIFDSLGKAAIIQKNYGGTGFNFSKIRPRGDRVRNVPKAASGPVDFLHVYSAALAKIIQGGKRHGGNMGILNVDHPDVLEFIKVKDEDETIKNFNISVGVSDEFMAAVEKDKQWEFINPRDDQVERKMSARQVFDQICQHAWLSGDPGLIFLDRLESDNHTPALGKLDTTNPCGEQPLLPFESCNLSSINLTAHIIKKRNHYQIDWNGLAKTAHILVRFLDNMIEVNTYILPETEKIVRYGNRKIGAGVIGFAHLLCYLGIPYNSSGAVGLAKRLAKFIRSELEKASIDLAKERGVFPNWDISTHKETGQKLRNCTVFTIAPTGTVSLIAHTTSGIEPIFALAYERRTSFEKDRKNRPGEVLFYVDPVLEDILKQNRLYSKKLVHKIIENNGSLRGLRELPSQMQKTFVTTHDISWEYHVRIQAAWQSYVDNSVSKTINLPNQATVEEVKKAYLLAWKLGCKGVTVYRDGCKVNQVMTASKNKKIKV